VGRSILNLTNAVAALSHMAGSISALREEAKNVSGTKLKELLECGI
jgi:hypothetical protein